LSEDVTATLGTRPILKIAHNKVLKQLLMISLLKKVRQKLITNNRIGKYLMYAVGEILLVVIGILIAVAINNRQQNRILHEKQQTYLKGLLDEFQTSKLKLAALIEVNRQNYLGAKTILKHTLNPEESLTEAQFSALIFKSLSSDIHFNANNSLLNEMISSGSLKDVSNNQLRILLTNWGATLEDILRQEEELSEQRNEVLNMFRTNEYSLRIIFEQADTNFELKANDRETSNLKLLNSLAFENNILMFYSLSYSTEQTHYNPLMKDLNAILNAIKKEIK
jgi:hypothetical protein